MLKVLLLGGGRRVSLAKRLINHDFSIFSYETEPHPPIEICSIVISGLKWDQEGIKDHLLNTVKDNFIDLVVPLQDGAVVLCAELALNAACPSLKAANICLDKRQLAESCKTTSFKELYPWVQEDCNVIQKPIFGANSQGLFKISWQEYQTGIRAETHVAQKLITGGKEFSVDCYFDKTSKMVDAVPRERLAISGGEVNRSKTLTHDHILIKHSKKLGEEIGLCGPVCIQFITDENDRYYLLEINARFGGGSILSLESGFDMIQMIKDEYLENKTVKVQDIPWKENYYMTRYYSEHFHKGQ